ncbi:hypothetical protein HK102_014036 [Quaeritorhiza haematococci]|nr:hypothetical protein HK102_014036 [Quaeritorhiza haematococci]
MSVYPVARIKQSTGLEPKKHHQQQQLSYANGLHLPNETNDRISSPISPMFDMDGFGNRAGATDESDGNGYAPLSSAHPMYLQKPVNWNTSNLTLPHKPRCSLITVFLSDSWKETGAIAGSVGKARRSSRSGLPRYSEIDHDDGGVGGAPTSGAGLLGSSSSFGGGGVLGRLSPSSFSMGATGGGDKGTYVRLHRQRILTLHPSGTLTLHYLDIGTYVAPPPTPSTSLHERQLSSSPYGGRAQVGSYPPPNIAVHAHTRVSSSSSSTTSSASASSSPRLSGTTPVAVAAPSSISSHAASFSPPSQRYHQRNSRPASASLSAPSIKFSPSALFSGLGLGLGTSSSGPSAGGAGGVVGGSGTGGGDVKVSTKDVVEWKVKRDWDWEELRSRWGEADGVEVVDIGGVGRGNVGRVDAAMGPSVGGKTNSDRINKQWLANVEISTYDPVSFGTPLWWNSQFAFQTFQYTGVATSNSTTVPPGEESKSMKRGPEPDYSDLPSVVGLVIRRETPKPYGDAGNSNAIFPVINADGTKVREGISLAMEDMDVENSLLQIMPIPTSHDLDLSFEDAYYIPDDETKTLGISPTMGTEFEETHPAHHPNTNLPLNFNRQHPSVALLSTSPSFSSGSSVSMTSSWRTNRSWGGESFGAGGDGGSNRDGYNGGMNGGGGVVQSVWKKFFQDTSTGGRKEHGNQAGSNRYAGETSLLVPSRVNGVAMVRKGSERVGVDTFDDGIEGGEDLYGQHGSVEGIDGAMDDLFIVDDVDVGVVGMER